jgi:hypothetical protein
MEIDTESQAHPFTPAEYERLAVFRQAVLVGFYTDQLHDNERNGSFFESHSFNEVMAAHLDPDAY